MSSLTVKAVAAVFGGFLTSGYLRTQVAEQKHLRQTMIQPSISSQSRERLWYYADANNEVVGPLSFAELERFAALGVVRADTQIIEDGGDEWRTYESVIPDIEASEVTSPITLERLHLLRVLELREECQKIPPTRSAEKAQKNVFWAATVNFFTQGNVPQQSVKENSPLESLPKKTWNKGCLLFAIAGASGVLGGLLLYFVDIEKYPLFAVLGGIFLLAAAVLFGRGAGYLEEVANAKSNPPVEVKTQVPAVPPSPWKSPIVVVGGLFIVGCVVLAIILTLQPPDRGETSQSAQPSTAATEPSMSVQTREETQQRRLKKNEVEWMLGQVEKLAVELEAQLAEIQNGQPVTMETAGKIKLWKSNVRGLTNMLKGFETQMFSASQHIALALNEMYYAWDYFERTAKGEGDFSLSHASSLKTMREQIRDAKTCIEQGDY